jgi:hypothetical protein
MKSSCRGHSNGKYCSEACKSSKINLCVANTNRSAAQATTPTTLQQAQTAALLALLNLNAPSDPSPIQRPGTPSGKASTGIKVPAVTGPSVWKVLVLDQQTKDVLATVLRVQDLRDVGVTLHV